MTIKSLYLAHPILDREWVRKEELRLEMELGLSLENPFYDGLELKHIKAVDAGMNHPWDGLGHSADWIVDKDLKAIDDNGGVLAIITESETAGTINEIFYSAKMKHYPTFLIMMKQAWWNHSWFNYTGITKFRTLTEFEEWFRANEMPKSINRP